MLKKMRDTADNKSSKPLILLFCLSIIGLSLLLGCEAEEERVEDQKEENPVIENLADKLYEQKAGYEDSVKVEKIISYLDFPEKYGYKESYSEMIGENRTLTIIFSPEHTTRYLTDSLLEVSGYIIFTLLDDLDELIYVFQPEEGIVESDRELAEESLSWEISNWEMELDKEPNTLPKADEFGTNKDKFKVLIEFYYKYIENYKEREKEESEREYEDQKPIEEVDLKPTKYETVNTLEGARMYILKGAFDRKSSDYVLENETQKDIAFREDYLLEINIEGMWYELPVIDDEYEFPDDMPDILEPEFLTFSTCELGMLYGELRPGEYRIIQEVWEAGGKEDSDVYPLAAEFKIY